MEPRTYNLRPYRPWEDESIALGKGSGTCHQPAGQPTGGQFVGCNDESTGFGDGSHDDETSAYIEATGWTPSADGQDYAEKIQGDMLGALNAWTGDQSTELRLYQKDQTEFYDNLLEKLNKEGELDIEEAEDMASEQAREIGDTAAELEDVLDLAPVYAGKVYRGIHDLPNDFNFKIDDEITLDAHASWTKSREVADRFSVEAGTPGKTSVQFVMKTKVGRDISEVSQYDDEKEVMLLKGHKMRVKKVTIKDERLTGESGRRIVHVELEEDLTKSKRVRVTD